VSEQDSVALAVVDTGGDLEVDPDTVPVRLLDGTGDTVVEGVRVTGGVLLGDGDGLHPVTTAPLLVMVSG
jgi:hypothetical protein